MQIFKIGTGLPQHRQRTSRHPVVALAPLVVALLLPKACESRVPPPALVWARPCAPTRLLHRFPIRIRPARIQPMANKRTKRRPTKHILLHWVRSTRPGQTICHRRWAGATKDSAIPPTRPLVLSNSPSVLPHALHPRYQSCRKIRWPPFRKDGHSSRLP